VPTWTSVLELSKDFVRVRDSSGDGEEEEKERSRASVVYIVVVAIVTVCGPRRTPPEEISWYNYNDHY
jgi:hypothetical protein